MRCSFKIEKNAVDLVHETDDWVNATERSPIRRKNYFSMTTLQNSTNKTSGEIKVLLASRPL